MARHWSEGTFYLEIPFTFECPHTGVQIPDWTFLVQGDGDRTTGEAYGWEITDVCQITNLGPFKGEHRAYFNNNWPIVAAVLKMLHDHDTAPGKAFNAAVHEAAFAQWQEAA